MNFRKLITYLTMGTAAAMPLAVAQNPTILQGNYISNVFGNSNFVLNPNAQTNVANVTNATRSTTTPLVATSEFTLSLASGANATWTLRAFDGGMKGQNCEARFTYRGFATATTKAEIVQNSLVVASLTLTPTTDPRIASINFPCGDLANLTTFRIAQTTAAMTGTNEIGGIYVGLATNMANVAQAEVVGGITFSGAGQNWITTSSSYADFAASGSGGTAFGNCTAPSTAVPHVTCNLKPGDYEIVATSAFVEVDGVNNGATCRIFDGTDTVAGGQIASYNTGTGSYTGKAITLTGRKQYTVAQSITFKVQCINFSGSATVYYASNPTPYQILVKRFPSSSELVVTPERQNVFGGVVYTAESQTLFSGTAAPTAYSSYNNATWNKPAKLIGKAQVTTTNSGNDLGFSIPNMPVGNYKVEISGLINAQNLGSTQTPSLVRCNYRIVETDSSGTVRTEVARQIHQDMSVITSPAEETRDYINAFFGVYNNTSVATRNFRLEAQKFSDDATGSVGGCQAFSSTGTNTYNSNIAFLLTPLDQPSNSALYVEGPVKAAATGAAIPAGYVGEIIAGASDTAVSVAASNTVKSVTTLTLNPGVYLITGIVYLDPSGMTVTRAQWSFCSTVVTNCADTNSVFGLNYGDGSQTTSGGYYISNISIPWRVTSTTTYNINANYTYTGTPGATPLRAVVRATRLN